MPDSITKQTAWGSTVGTSSASALASVTTAPTAQPGSARFTVTSVASAASVVSSGTVGSLTSPVATGPVLVTKGAAGIGLSAVTAGASLSAGTHTITVTQASAGASLTSTSALAPAVTIDASNNSISFYRDGASVPTSVTLAEGTYTPAQLAAEVGRASGGTLAGSLDASGKLTVTTAREGSTASLQLAAANNTLGLTDTTRYAGTDAHLRLDGVDQPPVTDLGAGDTLR